MAGVGPPPKKPGLRQRRNKVTGARTLEALKVRIRMPPLPKREPPLMPPKGDDGKPDIFAPRELWVPDPTKTAWDWHPLTRAFWRDVWRSPMAAEYLKADTHGLFILAYLVDRFWYGETELAGEIRLQRRCFGLTSMDRRSLQWEMEGDGRAAERQREEEEQRQPVVAAAAGREDPRRKVLQMPGSKNA